MAKAKRGSRRASHPSTGDVTPAAARVESGGFLGQVGLAETASGMSHGPTAIVLAVLAALILYPVGRLLRALRGRG
jgi:hypothetical protein